ncbi:hypothetical protein ACFWN7_08210 [Agromyces sp. NPDC058484]|uniref:hypothetical protein n=1 Tax=Agromyces sp. NPDC058484 TaxID=3346524 RepID=UPI00364B952F
MSDALRPGEPAEGEYTDSELPLDAELPKEEYDEADAGDARTGDTEPVEVDVIEIVDDDRA